MKKLSKPMLAIFLSAILLLSTSVTSFATDVSDPYGKCTMPKYEAVKQ
jgi:hypothetical protein